MVLRIVNKWIFLLLFIICVDSASSQNIPNNGWFVQNGLYKCHCKDGCENNGNCINNGQCSKEWFGLKCQYQDLVSLASTTLTHGIDKLTDRDDTTCLDSNVDLIINLNKLFVFTWLRIIVKDEKALSNFTVQLGKNNSPVRIECTHKKFYQVGNLALDIKCNITEEIQQVIISSADMKNLCSLYINGGRNVALKQEAWQTSVFSQDLIDYNASLAVDGDISGDFFQQKSCTHTATNDTQPMWKVHFSPSLITRYVLYNRNSEQERLLGFTLESNGSTNDVFTYKDGTADNKAMVFTVLDSKNRIITDVRIKKSNSKILTLCEVEIYGECPAGFWDLDCQKCDQTQCLDSCHIDDGTCNMICFGFINPPECNIDCTNGLFGINCKQRCLSSNCDKCQAIYGHCLRCKPGFMGGNCSVCPDSKWGIHCNMTCSKNCQQQNCNKTNGHCVNDCVAGFKPPECVGLCPDGWWGVNCNMTCSENCQQQNCNKTNGLCINGCVAGCQDGYWGVNCLQNCSKNCKSQPCNSTNGHCPSGCIAGYMSPFCNASCDSGHYGVNCSNSCSSNCEGSLCNAFMGSCFSCIPGYQGITCNLGCYDGKWGENCTQICNNNCYNKICNKVNGFCFEGCISGFKPPSCIEDCVKGHYGINCEQTCPSYCLENECNPISGFCKNSSTGDTEPVHKENNSGTDFGAGFGSGIGSAAVLFAIVLLLLYWWYRKKILILHKQSEGQNTYNQPDSLQLEKHVYETAATEEVHYNII